MKYDNASCAGGGFWENVPVFRLLGLLALLIAVPGLNAEVRVWEEDLILPSYRLGPPEPAPIFYRGESYQGAQKRVYPYALQDAITGEKRDETFRALYLENDYVKLCVLPEIGGRLFYATDKVNGYDFFYRQNVIKPALIGMLGAWISGGVEWCVFHHHRNTTHLPVDYALRENLDGSKTLWIGEIERRHRMRWMIGMTLRPGKSYIEVEVRMINRTPMPHSILYWANVAVHVNDSYQVIFPPSVQVATYHAKNDFVHWPIGQGRYQGSDYAGVDLSWWKNHPKSVSCFAWDLGEDFMGGYDHSREAGVVHVANHHVVSGAKLWEWAPGNIWDTQVLTDADGPYAEIMVGAYSDNQPDYSWIKPLEVKRFKQHWYPIRDIGGFKNANLDAAVNLEIEDVRARIGVQVTSAQPQARVELSHANGTVFNERVDLDPSQSFVREVVLRNPVNPTACRLRVYDQEGKVLIQFQPRTYPEVQALPEPVKRPVSPESMGSIEELYFTGLRIEQIHQPRVDPTDYYREALRRDPDDVRCNTQMGVHFNRRGLYAEAETHLRRAIERITTDYTRAKDTEAYFQLGLTLKALGRFEEAYDAFNRAAWDAAFYAPSHYQLAALACRAGDFAKAEELIEEAYSANTRNPRIQNLRIAVLRRLGEREEALSLATELSERDPLDRWSRNELRLLGGQSLGETAKDGRLVKSFSESGDPQPWMELATDYLDAGLTSESVELLERIDAEALERGAPSPLVAYYLAYASEQSGDRAGAQSWVDTAGERDPTGVFPFRLETVEVLNTAVSLRPQSSRPHYFLGDCLFESQPELAMSHWEKARALEPSLSGVHRNLGWGYQRVRNDPVMAIASYERAIECDATVPRYYLELDDLYEQVNTASATRLAMLDRNRSITQARKDLLIRRIQLLVATGAYESAIGLLTENQFYISEGGGNELAEAYVDAHVLHGLALLDEGRAADAKAAFEAASRYPANLSQEAPRNESRMPQINYYASLAEATLGNDQEARRLREQVARTDRSRSLDAKYYQALALAKLNETERAGEVADDLVAAATTALGENAQTDVFAKFGEQTSRSAQRADDMYRLALGKLALGEKEEARRHLETAITLDQAHVWAAYQRGRLDQGSVEIKTEKDER